MMVMTMILTMVMMMAMILYGDDDDDCFAGVGKGRPDHHLYNPPAISQVPFVTILIIMVEMIV